MWTFRAYLYTALLVIIAKSAIAEEVSPWRWTCENQKCVKTRNDPRNTDPVLSLEACKMFCNEYGVLWPRPTGQTDLGNFLSKLNLNNVEVEVTRQGRSDSLMTAAVERFKNSMKVSVPRGVSPKAAGKGLFVYIVNQNPDMKEFSLNFDESYSLRVSPTSSGNGVNATIFAPSFFGIRHGLETLSQLIVYDDIRNNMLIVRDVSIDDKPVYPYRGILLDTSRNYITVDVIKSIIDTMAVVKMNTFHWHITDSQSFPFVSERRPELTKLGAYTPSKVYTTAAIREVVQFGAERGVRVVPELDAPAHVGEGWQDSGLTVCFKAEPWAKFCVEPPCGQLNPTNEKVYDYLEDIYLDMAKVFDTDIFHMGGDEVSERCWNSSEEIQHFMIQNRWDLDKASYLKLWNYFQKKAQDKAYKAFGKKLPLILWTSTLTEFTHIENFLDKDDYIIQVWTTGTDPQVRGLLEKGYRLIMSNYDALYFDCGYGAWVGEGNNWCSPYIGWQKVYDNSPAAIAQEYKDQILGGEATLWTEQADSSSAEGRLWPRAAALAERLWAEPAGTWRDAEYRMLNVRERFINMGVQAESLQPQWCYQNEGYCYN